MTMNEFLKLIFKVIDTDIAIKVSKHFQCNKTFIERADLFYESSNNLFRFITCKLPISNYSDSFFK